MLLGLLVLLLAAGGGASGAGAAASALAGRTRINSGSLTPSVGAPRAHAPPRRRDVYIAGFFPFGKHVAESRLGRGVMPAVKLAVDHINDNPDVLHNYRLHIYWNDTEVSLTSIEGETKCNAAVGVKAFFDMMHDEPHKLMLFGAACTQVTDPIAKASKHWRITQLSYADTHPMFTPDNFPNFFRIVPSENAFNAPRLRLLEAFNWTRVGTIYQNEPRYSLAHNKLVADLDDLKAEVVETQSFANDPSEAVAKLRAKDVRIVLGNFNETWARSVLCEALKQGMIGRKHQWLLMGTYSERWWEDEPRLDIFEDVTPRPGDCNADQLREALEGVILTDLLPLSTSGDVTVAGITADEYKAEYDLRRGREYSRFHGYTYDGIWTVALAIQHVARAIHHFRPNQTVSDFHYRDVLWENLFLEALRNTSFEGVTGPVRFYNNERKANFLLKQFQDGEEVKIGEFNGVTEQLDLSLGEPIKWHGRGPPKDRTITLIEHTRIDLKLYALLATICTLGIIMAIIFLVINITYRNQRYIKMSSPYLNNMIIVGCMLTYLSVIFLGLDSQLTSVSSFPYICTARAWLLMSGFSLAFGSMFSKTWRVHSIFTDLKLNKKVIKDYQLFMVVGILLMIDVAIMTTWQVTDPFYRETKQMESYPHATSPDTVIIPENEYCQSNKMTYFIGGIYAYKGLLLIFGAFLAWETRHVSIPALNDSKYVGMSVYNVVIMCVMGAAISFVLSDQKDASFIIISVFIIFCTTGTLCLVFVPKLIELRRNPQGSMDKRLRATLKPMTKNARRDSTTSEMEEKLRDAKGLNQRFRKTLRERDTELQALIQRLGSDAEDLPGDPPSRLTVPKDTAPRREEVGIDPANQSDTPGQRKRTNFNKLPTISASKETVAMTMTTSEPPAAVLMSSTASMTIESTPEERHTSEKSCGVDSDVSDDDRTVPEMDESDQEVPLPSIRKGVSFSDVTGDDESPPTGRRPPTPKHTTPKHKTPQPPTPPPSLRRRASSGARTPTHQGRRPSAPAIAAKEHGHHHHGHHHHHHHHHHAHHQPAHYHDVSRSEEVLLDEPESPHSSSPMQRSVSERSRGGSSSSLRAAASAPNGGVDAVAAVPTSTGSRGRTKSAAAYSLVQSSPNVSMDGAATLGRVPNKKQHINNNMSAADLADNLAILPIFQKLLSERHRTRGGYSIASCPNISIKCDIVEYL
ncbi:Hypothetical predicted protein [Cloeon dipterum]|uniref:Gamma-aminobutyric acid type B receptor subunit 2 n=1 Tax=Cloeon dipterum TaxID=197152 RepID=A0A8S1DET1_9INSE|nr:Hypothetical predicted protein [Cloeon dipterum]